MRISRLIVLLSITMFAFNSASAQADGLLKRTTYKTDRFDFGSGGTVVVIGSPKGSIRIEGWKNREIEISAEIEVQAPTEQGLERLSSVTGFILEESTGRTGIISVGNHDKKGIRKLDKKFPKELLSMPSRINYVIKVPQYSDVEINGGNGDLAITGIDGVIRVNFLQVNGKIDLVGGGLDATFGAGNVDITIPTRSWRGRFAEVQMAMGTMNLFLPAGLNASFDASVLRTGRIENEFTGFKPRIRNGKFTERLIEATSGIGTIPLKFTVGDGILRINEAIPAR